MKTTYREAVREALHEALVRDPRVFLMGEDVGRYGGSYAVSKGFLDEFGSERIRDTPLSELAFVGAGIGAALGGMRPIVTITVTNLGDQSVEVVHGVIYPSQVALIGFGRISERPWVEAGRVIAAPVVTLTLAADHRASDGHRGALFLNETSRLLQDPPALDTETA
jgi:hypothetical protein